LNTQIKTLHFFVDGTQLSHSITNIHTTLLSFGISAGDTPSSSVEIISFLLLRKSSFDNNAKCAEYDWVGKEDDDLSCEDSSDSFEVDSDDK
jgi:hypothetical protein